MINQKFAVVDLETSGNDINKDSIIQLSIVFIEQREIIDQYTTFLSDRTDLSVFIQELTNIDADMLEGAPAFKDIAHEVYDKLKNHVFVAHNVDFDLTFLQNHFSQCGLHFSPYLTLDTVELSKIFLPAENSFQLADIASGAGIELSNAHRADEDALATARLLLHLFEKMMKTNSETLKQLYHLSKNLRFSLADLIFSILSEAELGHPPEHLKRYDSFYINEMVLPAYDLPKYTVEELYDRYIAGTGAAYRADQLKLANEIFSHFEEGRHLAIEAYTGIGKTGALLIAAVSFHSMYQDQVLVSTSRKILQNQMVNIELEKLTRALDLNLEFINLKGRENYLDLNAVSALLETEDNNPEIVLLKMRILTWLLETVTGDLSEIGLRGPEQAYYKTMLIQTGKNDSHYYFDLALKKASRAPIVFTNHYFIQDCLEHLDGVKHIIVDEAHQLKNALDQRTETEYAYHDMKFFVGQVGTPRQNRLLSSYIENNDFRQAYLLEELMEKLNEHVDMLFNAIQAGNLESAGSIIRRALEFCSIFLGTIRGTNQYQALYNHMHYFSMSLTELSNAIENGNYTIQHDRNIQRLKFIVTKPPFSLLGEAHGTESLIMMSGTLEVKGTFDHLKDLFNGEEYDTAIISNASLFSNTKLFIPDDIPDYDHNDDEYVYALLDYIAMYLSETEGKLLVIFSSYELLHKVYEMTKEIDMFNDFIVLRQNRSGSPDKLLMQYNQLDKALLLATSSFSEGINIEGTDDKCIMISKLPFPVPKGNDFKSFYTDDLPRAVFQFRQLAGRVKRNENDKGLVLLLDKRIMYKPYRNAFLKYFPEENIINGPRKAFKHYLSDL
ncbi:helicase C-terminal domain-containing protein [Salinicoccus kekensis]|uniref:3'-5' exonuclease DinG n=1 Tax=Salinicoccus kekensis TaxID=714307 RepID=A0A285UAW0_9STAP|nr:helicase C-terminal domain-containing protein [Salinicoccus kekensis]SOC38863.1 ATP-dependent DNA helicase DinG [Salinicoccus kekensis]